MIPAAPPVAEAPVLPGPLFLGATVYRGSSYGGAHPLRVPRVSTVIDLARALGWLGPDRYRTSPRDFRVTFRVNCITYRNNATMTISNMGVPQDEGQLLRSFSLGLELEKLLRSQGIEVRDES